MKAEHWVYTLPLRLRSLFRSRQVEQELDEELRYHLERKIEENISRGMTPEHSSGATNTEESPGQACPGFLFVRSVVRTASLRS